MSKTIHLPCVMEALQTHLMDNALKFMRFSGKKRKTCSAVRELIINEYLQLSIIFKSTLVAHLQPKHFLKVQFIYIFNQSLSSICSLLTSDPMSNQFLKGQKKLNLSFRPSKG